MQRQGKAATNAGVKVVVSDEPDATIAPSGVALLIDALLGTGLSGPPRPGHAEVIERMRGVILSVDVPSGLDADLGRPAGPAVRATATAR